MFFVTPNTYCSNCSNKLTNWDYRYQGRHYCRKCYDRLFSTKKCSKCGHNKKIRKGLSPPICKKCLLQNKPCIRCKKTDYLPGKLTVHGSVCKSCAKYFREYKQCNTCSQFKYHVSNRRINGKKVGQLCCSCYNKIAYCTCNKCHKKRNPFYYDFDQRAYCKQCTQIKNRQCTDCKKNIPAGIGKVCEKCSFRRTLSKRVKFYKPLLSDYFQQHFLDFAEWLVKRRGTNFAATSIKRYFEYFFQLDQFALEIKRFPSYQQILHQFSVKKTRKYLLVTKFLDELEIVKLKPEIKEQYSHLNTIEKYITYFEAETTWHSLINDYYVFLKQKHITLKSLRLALTPAFHLLKNCQYFCFENPTQDILDGYLWGSPGQKSAISGFINFLKQSKGIYLKIDQATTGFMRPKMSKKLLQKKLIDCLRSPKNNTEYNQRLLKLSIEYLHAIAVPTKAYLRVKIKDQSLNINGYHFYIPDEIFKS